MKKSVPVLLAAAFIHSGAAMADGPIDGNVYGKINLSVVNQDDGANDESELTSNASRFGFKGKSDIDLGLKAVYQLEYEIAPDDGKADDDEFKQRNTFAGLESETLGQIIAGIHDTPLKKAQKKVDLFNDLPGADIKNLVNGEERLKNVVQYTTPKFGGVKASIMRQVNDETSEDNNGTSVAISYSAGDLYLAAAADTNVDDKTSKKDTTRFVAQYKMDSLTLGALLNDSEPTDGSAKSESGIVVSGAYKIDRTTLKLQLASSDEKSKGNEQLAFGVDYKLGKSTKAYAYYSAIEDDAKVELTTTAIGVEHKF